MFFFLPYYLSYFYLASKDNTPALSTSSEAAARGFLAISLTFSSILSIGESTRLLASLVNMIEAIESTIQTNNVLHMDNIDVICELNLLSQNATKGVLSSEYAIEAKNSSVLKFYK